ncbi:MAG: hypothetical protein ABL949_02980 [Fimbriimonadaceae bacterium]
MQRLKTITNALMIFGVILMFGIPFVWIRKPVGTAPIHDRRVFAVTLTIYMMVMFLVLAAVILCAYLVLRKQREEFQQQSLDNLKELVEGTLSDHAKKVDD